MKEIIIEILKKHIKIPVEKHIEIPPDSKLGDYSFPCFILSREFKKNPETIAKNLKEKISKKLPKEIEKIEAASGYLNFFINKEYLAEKIINEILKKKENYGKTKKENRKIMVEFPSPNTNKPLHLGHLRNMSIGESLARILEFQGNKIIRANLNNDRGIHICKSMLAYQKFGKNLSPEKAKKKSDHFVGNFYVLFNKELEKNPDLDKEALELLIKWEKGDKSTIQLWKKMNQWALEGFNETYKKFGIKIDKNYYESQIYKKGKEIILDGLKKKIFYKKQDGAIAINLENEGLDEKIVLRTDGTSVYITQDIYLAKLKFDQYKLDKSIYIVGNEQDYHFRVLFFILKRLGFKFANKLKHLSYGMVFLPEGKMKSRQGKVVDADDLIGEIQNMVKKELNSRYKLSQKELESRSLKISLAAIKYHLLKIEVSKNMIFNPDESISFEGDTGPYLQYSYARASSILRKVKKKKNKFKIENLNQSEISLIKKLSEFPDVISKAYSSLNPSIIANYSFQLAQIFNEFYHLSPVINSDNEQFRVQLVQAFRYVLKNLLNLLGIDVLEEM